MAVDGQTEGQTDTDKKTYIPPPLAGDKNMKIFFE